MSNPLLSPELKRSLARFLTGRPEILFAVLYGVSDEFSENGIVTVFPNL